MARLSRLLFAFLFIFFSACASRPTEEAFQTRIYVGSYDDVWLAALKTLTDYPLKISNKDTGKILSEIVNGPYNELVLALPEPIELPERYRYSLELSFAKLTSEKNQPLVRIRVRKALEKFHDFYTGWLATGSDGLEEKILLYRVEHILKMEKQLQKGSNEPEATAP